MRKLFLKIGDKGYTMGGLHTEINAGMIIAYMQGDRQWAIGKRRQPIAHSLFELRADC